jgi:hypothetical protein
MRLHPGTTLYFLGIGYFAGLIGLLVFFFGLNGFGSCTGTYIAGTASSGTAASYSNDVSSCGSSFGVGAVGMGFLLFFFLIIFLTEVWGAEPVLDRRGIVDGSDKNRTKRIALLFGLQVVTVVLVYVIVTALLYYIQLTYG